MRCIFVDIEDIVDYYSLLGSSDLELPLIIWESGKTIV